MVVRLPPLRARKDDIRPLAERFLRDANVANSSHINDIDPSAMELLEAYTWPGNVRELRNVIERAVVIATGDQITADDLAERVRSAGPYASSAPGDPAASWDKDLEGPGDFRSRVERIECEIILDALRSSGFNQSEAARRLQMPLRTMQYKVRVYGLRKPERA
jgi:DNA-binding NtrC family response regulator